jgi:hypothetical protein
MVGYNSDLSTALAAPRPSRFVEIGPTTALLLAGLVLPNVLSLGTLFNLIDIGLPPRSYAIALYALLAVAARRVSFPVLVTCFAIVLIEDLVCTISLMFRLAPLDLLAALRFASRVHVFESPLYVALFGVMLANSAAIVWLLRDRARLLKGNIAVLLGGMAIFLVVDYVSNVSPYFTFGALLGRNQPVVTAGETSGFDKVAGKNGRNVVYIIVESMGYLKNPAARDLVSSPLNDPAIQERYTVTSGHSGYYGSTTNGEMRELCDTRTPYKELTKDIAAQCLPAQLHRRGYQSFAFHSFSGEMFDRTHWYPILGFDKIAFGEDLLPKLKRTCGTAFPGACDVDVAGVIAREAAQTTKPKLIYWLTLNTHIPVAPGYAVTNFNCENPGGRGVFQRAGVCRMGELWHDLFGSIAKLALDPAIGPAEILVVGDHAPPLWSRAGREMFMPGQVAWYRLTPKDADSAHIAQSDVH